MNRLDTEETGRITITDLGRLTQVLKCEYDAVVTSQGDGFWRVQFLLAGHTYMLGTVRGSIRRWRQLDAVIAFLQSNCPDSSQVRLQIGPWMFCRN
ncbi:MULTISPECIES: hypothetical protein [Cupriavidus]|uniref:hypothetical protein n=1 Tax=Cupriavidus TaxID=106589 RepID=UPI00037586A0|nr:MULTISPECIES: hypothetical protein [Cupriavidus]